MPESSFFKRLSNYSIRDFLGYLIAAVGAAIFLLASRYVKGSEFWHDILRDVGIAFLVAIIVSVIYELFARSRYDAKIREGEVHVVLEEIVHKDIWREVRRQVIEKDMIREKTKIKMRLKRDPGLFGQGSSQAVLWLDFSYELNGLRSRRKKVALSHKLYDHIKREDHMLPRFEDIIIGKQVYDCKTAMEQSIQQNGHDRRTLRIKGAVLNLAKGEFRKDVNLQPREGVGVPVETRRFEITYVPGSYNLNMGEMTQGLSILLQELPAGIEAEVNIWPHTTEPVPLTINRMRDFKDLLMLPGQTIEFRFRAKELLRLTDGSPKSKTTGPASISAG